MDPSAPLQEQLVEWIRDCLALCDGADKPLYNEALEQLRVLFEEYQRRFPIRGADDLLH